MSPLLTVLTDSELLNTLFCPYESARQFGFAVCFLIYCFPNFVYNVMKWTLQPTRMYWTANLFTTKTFGGNFLSREAREKVWTPKVASFIVLYYFKWETRLAKRDQVSENFLFRLTLYQNNEFSGGLRY